MHEHPAAIPRFAPGVRLRFNPVRGQHVLLSPERAFVPDPIALAILQQIDGTRSVAGIVATLAATYAAAPERIAADVWTILHQMAARGALCFDQEDTSHAD